MKYFKDSDFRLSDEEEAWLDSTEPMLKEIEQFEDGREEDNGGS